MREESKGEARELSARKTDIVNWPGLGTVARDSRVYVSPCIAYLVLVGRADGSAVVSEWRIHTVNSGIPKDRE